MPYPLPFEGIVADRQGDVRILQDKPEQALEQYRKAYDKLADNPEYRRLVEFKLNALGVQPAKASVATAGQGVAG